MIKIGQRGFYESLAGQGWNQEIVEEVHTQWTTRERGLYASAMKLMERRERSDNELRREKLFRSYEICMNKLLNERAGS